MGLWGLEGYLKYVYRERMRALNGGEGGEMGGGKGGGEAETPNLSDDSKRRLKATI